MSTDVKSASMQLPYDVAAVAARFKKMYAGLVYDACEHFGLTGRAVDTTIVGGRLVMQNRVLTALDEREICSRSRKLAEKVWERI